METKRIILRPWRESDAEILFKWASDPDVGPRAGWPPHKSVEESLEIIRTVFNDATNTWAIELKETGEAIGAMGYGPSCECDLPAREGEPLLLGGETLLESRYLYGGATVDVRPYPTNDGHQIAHQRPLRR